MKEQEKPIKIAFVGTSSIGKTTLLEQLRQKYKDNPNVEFVDEAARVFFTENPTISDRFSSAVQSLVQDLQLSFENEAHNSEAEIIFCDRSVVDAIVYSRSTGDIEGSDALFDKVAGWLPTYYTFLLLNPVDVPYEKDEIRQEELEVRQRFHEAFLEFFEEKGIPYELFSGTIEERMDKIDKLLSMI